MSEHVWKFGDWAESLGRRCRYVSTVEHHGNLVMKYFVFESGHILHATNAIPLTDCDSWGWKPEPKYRPFANAEEFKPHRDRWVSREGNVGRVCGHDEANCYFVGPIGSQYSGTWGKCFSSNIVFDDTKLPFGVEVTE